MAELTLVPTDLAKPGYRFRYMGDPGDEACDGCPVRSLCYRLPEVGRLYEVVEARAVEHPCGLHEGKARPCTVKAVATMTSVEAKHLKGTAVSWKPIPCGYPECANYALCHPVGLPVGRYSVSQETELECPMHYRIKRVALEPI